MIKVKATAEYTKHGITDSKLGMIPEEGYEFEVDEQRFDILTKTNDRKLVFVKKVEEPKEVVKPITESKSKKK